MKQKMTIGKFIDLLRRGGRKYKWDSGDFYFHSDKSSCAVGMVMRELGYDITSSSFADRIGYRINDAIYFAARKADVEKSPNHTIISINDQEQSFEDALKQIKINYGPFSNVEFEFEVD